MEWRHSPYTPGKRYMASSGAAEYVFFTLTLFLPSWLQMMPGHSADPFPEKRERERLEALNDDCAVQPTWAERAREFLCSYPICLTYIFYFFNLNSGSNTRPSQVDVKAMTWPRLRQPVCSHKESIFCDFAFPIPMQLRTEWYYRKKNS